jgi:hypothetical protein
MTLGLQTTSWSHILLQCLRWTPKTSMEALSKLSTFKVWKMIAAAKVTVEVGGIQELHVSIHYFLVSSVLTRY